MTLFVEQFCLQEMFEQLTLYDAPPVSHAAWAHETVQWVQVDVVHKNPQNTSVFKLTYSRANSQRRNCGCCFYYELRIVCNRYLPLKVRFTKDIVINTLQCKHVCKVLQLTAIWCLNQKYKCCLWASYSRASDGREKKNSHIVRRWVMGPDWRGAEEFLKSS